MKKILLIEDRCKRQELFTKDTNIELNQYGDILDNFTGEEYDAFLSSFIKDDFSLENYAVIIVHKSAFHDKNTQILLKLSEYCKIERKPLVLFSGGLSANYYKNDEFETLELNSKIFYSQNLKLFLEDFKNNNQNILILCYGIQWKLNIALNILEKLNRFIEKNNEKTKIYYDKILIEIDFDKLKSIQLKFDDLVVENGWITLSEVVKLRDCMFQSMSEFIDE